MKKTINTRIQLDGNDFIEWVKEKYPEYNFKAGKKALSEVKVTLHKQEKEGFEEIVECPYPLYLDSPPIGGFNLGDKVSCKENDGNSCKFGYIVAFNGLYVSVASEEFESAHSGYFYYESFFKDSPARGKIWHFKPKHLTKLK